MIVTFHLNRDCLQVYVVPRIGKHVFVRNYEKNDVDSYALECMKVDHDKGFQVTVTFDICDFRDANADEIVAVKDLFLSLLMECHPFDNEIRVSDSQRFYFFYF